MADKPTFGKFEFRFAAPGDWEQAAAQDPSRPFVIGVLGDFSGRGNRGVCETGDKLAKWAVRIVDRDNLEEVMQRLAPQLAIEIDQQTKVDLQFTELDDFHPDQIYGRLELFQSLRDMRRRLDDPKTFREAAAELGWAASPAKPASDQPRQSGTSAPQQRDETSDQGLLDSILAGAQSDAPLQQMVSGRGSLDELVRRIAEPFVVPGRDPLQPQYVADFDEAIGRTMRAVLHHPAFQQLEAAWRGLNFLTRRLETGAELKVCLIDVTKAELEADLLGVDDLADSAAFRLLVERSTGTPGVAPWALWVGDYMFAATTQDIELLGRLAKLAEAAGAAIVAAADPSLVGCGSPAEISDLANWRPPAEEVDSAWQALRRLPESSHVGLILPRFLLRLPYGSETSATESFSFDELGSGLPAHDAYLWGNSGWIVACLLGQAFSEMGWQFRPGTVSQIDGLPLHVFKLDGEAQVTPCVEAELIDRVSAKIAERGIMPLRGVRNSDAAILRSFTSVSEQGSDLAGKWG